MSGEDCRDRRHVAFVPIPIEKFIPFDPDGKLVIPLEISNTQPPARIAAAWEVEDRAPEEYLLLLPLLRDELRSIDEKVQNIGVQDREAAELLAKHMSRELRATLLEIVGVELDQIRMPGHKPPFLMFFHMTEFRQEGRSIGVDFVLLCHDFRVPRKKAEYTMYSPEFFDHLLNLSNGQVFVTHSYFLFCLLEKLFHIPEECGARETLESFKEESKN
jgi:hypothetical protein